MAKTVKTKIGIEASKERVWAILTDFPAYSEWNPFITSISGEPKAGERLEVRLAPPGGKEMTFRPQVLSANPGRELKWLGHLIAPGIFDGEHRFFIQDAGEGGTGFTQEEVFKGALVPFLGKGLERTKQGFEEMNRALRERAESDAGRSTHP